MRFYVDQVQKNNFIPNCDMLNLNSIWPYSNLYTFVKTSNFENYFFEYIFNGLCFKKLGNKQSDAMYAYIRQSLGFIWGYHSLMIAMHLPMYLVDVEFGAQSWVILVDLNVKRFAGRHVTSEV